MTIFRFTEARDSWQSAMNPPTVTGVWNASGSNDPAFVRGFAFGGTPAIVATTFGVLYREDIILDPVGFELWRVTVPYSQRKYVVGEYRLAFDTTGGTIHITQSKQTLGRFPANAPDHQGAIGVRGPDEIDGTDIIIPALKVTAYFRHPAASITIAKIKQLARVTGTINSDNFLSFAAGEVLFLGASGTEGSQTEAEVQYTFAMSENANLTIGAIANVAKRGWDYVWVKYKDAVNNNKPVKQPEFAYVERVYEERAFVAEFGFGA